MTWINVYFIQTMNQKFQNMKQKSSLYEFSECMPLNKKKILLLKFSGMNFVKTDYDPATDI